LATVYTTVVANVMSTTQQKDNSIHLRGGRQSG